MVGQRFVLKHSIFNIGDDVTKVFDGNIVYTTECVTEPYEEGSTYPAPKTAAWFGTEIQITKILERADFVEVWCRNVDSGETSESISVLLANQPNGAFSKAFNSLFSDHPNYTDKKSEGLFKNPNTKKGLIKYFGFPVSVCRENGVEIYYYNHAFLGFEVEGYHDVWFKLDKKGRVIEVYGII